MKISLFNNSSALSKQIVSFFNNQNEYLRKFNNLSAQMDRVSLKYIEAKYKNDTNININTLFMHNKTKVLSVVVGARPKEYEKYITELEYKMFNYGAKSLVCHDDKFVKHNEYILKIALLNMLEIKPFVADKDKAKKAQLIYNALDFRYCLFAYLSAINEYIVNKEGAPEPVHLISIAKERHKYYNDIIQTARLFFQKKLDK